MRAMAELPSRVADMDPKAARLMVRDAVFWGVLMANFFAGAILVVVSLLLR
jgi:hypothetical protein